MNIPSDLSKQSFEGFRSQAELGNEGRPKRRTTPARGRRALLLWTLLAGIIWCGILPAISRQPRIRAEIEHFDSLGIDPSAMFYTDLDLMDDVLTRIDRFQRDNPRALWIPSAKKRR